MAHLVNLHCSCIDMNYASLDPLLTILIHETTIDDVTFVFDGCGRIGTRLWKEFN